MFLLKYFALDILNYSVKFEAFGIGARENVLF